MRKRSFIESQGSNSPLSRFNSPMENIFLSRYNSLLEKFETLQDIEFDLNFEQSLFRTKSESDLHETVIDLDFISFIETKKECAVR